MTSEIVLDVFHEHLVWMDVNQTMPDDSMIVLVKTPSPSEPVWFGYFDSEDVEWLMPDGMPFSYKVTYWADMPTGPQVPS